MRDGGVLCGFGAPDGDARGDEAANKQRDAGAGRREADVSEEEQSGADREDSGGADAVAGASGWDAGECGGGVVGRVEHERELDRAGMRPA